MNIPMIVLMILPLLGFSMTLMCNNTQEKVISTIASIVSFSVMPLNVFLLFQYYSHDFTALHQPLLTLYKTEGYSYSLMAYYDWISGIFSLVGGFLFWLISRYSKSYMHREHGFKRFYNHFLLLICLVLVFLKY